MVHRQVSSLPPVRRTPCSTSSGPKTARRKRRLSMKPAVTYETKDLEPQQQLGCYDGSM